MAADDLDCQYNGVNDLNAVVVSFDSLHLGFLGCYGNAWIVTPNFDRLAAEAAVFDLHFGENFAPLAENQAWWTGRRQFPLSTERQRSLPVFPALLREQGVSTWLAAESPLGDAAVPSAEKSLGFERAVFVGGRDGLDVDESETPFARLVTRAIEELQQCAGRSDERGLFWLKSQGVPSPPIPPRLFGTLYLDEFLEDEEPPSEDADEPDERSQRSEPVESADSPAGVSPAAEALLEGLSELLWSLESAVDEEQSAGAGEPLDEGEWALVRAVYAGYVTLLDRWLGRLLDAIEALPPDRRPLLIVTAAAGQSLGESRARRKPLGRLAEEIVHTPLLIRLPDAADRASRRRELVQTIDLAPTLFEWFVMDKCLFPGDGRSLLPLARGGPAEAVQAFQQDRKFLFWGAGGRCAVRSQDFYLIQQSAAAAEAENALLFQKPGDLWDVHDVAGQHPETAAELQSTLNAYVK